MRKTKIVATMGPACDSPSALRDMIRSGMNVARLNMAHGDFEEHRGRIRKVRAAAEEVGAIVPILMDIKGPEIRIGKLQAPSYELKAGDKLTLTTETIEGTAERVSVTYMELPQVIRPGGKVLIDDGLLELSVDSVEGTEVVCTVTNHAFLKPRKGVNLPGVKTTLPGITERDISHIDFGIAEGIDILAVSFVRNAKDIMKIRGILEEKGASRIQIISKIENEEGVDELDAIVAASDGIMVARGDLGVEIPTEDVPILQRRMIERCNAAGKPVIIATQMLDSMQVNPRPTRAEVSDVANAVLQGADAVMLSGETAAGKYPLESVRMMASIAIKTEATIDYGERFLLKPHRSEGITEVVSRAVVNASIELGARAIVTPTCSGFTARMVSKYRPSAPILAVAPDDHTLMALQLLWGVFPVRGVTAETTDNVIASALREGGQVVPWRSGDIVVITAGVPAGKSGSTNLIRIHQAE
ncbi:pyruvate kinase [Paenibacillus antri]|uniref:Pyruvate kinase n=1 Tax=Paenibacillus antri TaxID=2582848 RepID=A0A5R9GDL9_9BACL|nr:pyruvate kinase [Paenibacillus antri]TLS52436.1 pyruvate kinase [Paenibacillus antri]